MKTTATRATVQVAIDMVNREKGYQLEIHPECDHQKGKWYNFRLKTRSKIPGAKVSWQGRNIAAASWHAHGFVFDEILQLNPDAVIKSMNSSITATGGNWEDYNVGSMMQSVMASQCSII